ncbi:MAG: DUF4860 domain-containing protein [Roseburia sp.]|nr:DUF4860 domain-containing protein [Roseburia sp.]
MVRLNRDSSRAIDTFFILALLALFSITSFFVIIIGARQYHSIADRMTENYETRTASSYLVEKFHQHDITGSVSIVDLDGVQAVSLMQSVNGSRYSTYIYAYDGYLREITVSEGTDISPESGQKIIEASALSIEACSNNLYCFTLTDTYGNDCPVYISWNAK